jgi:glycosyltransferase involved in cell wall biosynthesis
MGGQTNSSVQDKVSIIIPAFNASEYIDKTIESVLQQTWENWELIIVNDGSTDRTQDVVRPYLRDPRIIYHEQTNQGCSGAKNTGLRISTGSFIQYLDADDLLSKEKIHEQVSIIKNNFSCVAVCKTKVFELNSADSSEEIDTDFLYDTDNTFDFLLNLYGLKGKIGMIQPNAFLISRELSDKAGYWDMSISPSPDEDGEYFCRVLLNAKSIRFAPSGINYYRKNIKNVASLSRQKSFIHTQGALRSLELKAQHLLSIEHSERVLQVIALHYAGFTYLYHADFPELCREAEREMSRLGIKKFPIVGGQKFKSLAKIIGFKNALRVKQVMRF